MKYVFRYVFIGLLIFTGCNSKNIVEVPPSSKAKSIEPVLVDEIGMNDSILTLFYEIGLVDIQEVNPKIMVDIKYATKDNFMHRKLYDTLDRIFLQSEIAERLSACQFFLDSIKPGFRLLVFDGLRPLQVQQEMWDALDSIPVSQRGRFVSNPNFGSVHNFGAAVDLTILDSLGNQLDMGAGYDDFRDIAFPKFEHEFLASGELSTAQWENRKLLRRVMKRSKFRNIPSEWWHFNGYSRITASHKYQMILSESGQAQSFKIVPKIETHSDSVLKPSMRNDSL